MPISPEVVIARMSDEQVSEAVKQILELHEGVMN
jgi:hypothetical protein